MLLYSTSGFLTEEKPPYGCFLTLPPLCPFLFLPKPHLVPQVSSGQAVPVKCTHAGKKVFHEDQRLCSSATFLWDRPSRPSLLHKAKAAGVQALTSPMKQLNQIQTRGFGWNVPFPGGICQQCSDLSSVLYSRHLSRCYWSQQTCLVTFTSAPLKKRLVKSVFLVPLTIASLPANNYFKHSVQHLTSETSCSIFDSFGLTRRGRCWGCSQLEGRKGEL